MAGYDRIETTTVDHHFTLTEDEMSAMEHGHVCKVRLGTGDFIEIRRTNGE